MWQITQNRFCAFCESSIIWTHCTLLRNVWKNSHCETICPSDTYSQFMHTKPHGQTGLKPPAVGAAALLKTISHATLWCSFKFLLGIAQAASDNDVAYSTAGVNTCARQQPLGEEGWSGLMCQLSEVITRKPSAALTVGVRCVSRVATVEVWRAERVLL